MHNAPKQRRKKNEKHVKPSKIFIANKVLTWLHNLSKIGTCLRTAVARSEHDFIPIEVTIKCCLHGMWSWLSSRCDTAVHANKLAEIGHPLTKTQDLFPLISGPKHPERITLSSVLVFTLGVSLRKAHSHYSEHKANQWDPALLIRGTCHISFGSCAVM